MFSTFKVIDKLTEEKLTGYHDCGAIYEFDRVSRPHLIYTTWDDIFQIRGKIERHTGRKLALVTID